MTNLTGRILCSNIKTDTKTISATSQFFNYCTISSFWKDNNFDKSARPTSNTRLYIYIYNIHRYSIATVVFLCLIDLCKDILTLRFTDRHEEFYQRTLTPGVHFMLPETRTISTPTSITWRAWLRTVTQCQVYRGLGVLMLHL